MINRHKLLVGNWKMNPENSQEATLIIKYLRKNIPVLKNTDVIICPPFVFLPKAFSPDFNIILGSQNISDKDEGSKTGEIGPKQLISFGVKYSIIGHSERRELGESNELIAQKALEAVAYNITPIVCIGEKERDEEGQYLEFITNQIKSALSLIKRSEIWKIVFAYEPIWAIGKDNAMNPNNIHEMVLFIRKVVTDTHGPTFANEIKILYGGSVDEKNTKEIIWNGKVDGLLVGRSSLDPKRFIEIAKIIEGK